MEKIEVVSTPADLSGITVISVDGPLTLNTLFDFQTAIRQPGLGDTIIDVTNVPYIDSAGLGAILGHWAHTQRTGKKFALSGVNERVRVLLDLTKVSTLLPSFPAAEDARQNLAGSFGLASRKSV
jgi:anti-sigma B factor antagonist